MSIKHWILIGMITLNALAGINQIGKPRSKKKASDGALETLEWALIAWLALS